MTGHRSAVRRLAIVVVALALTAAACDQLGVPEPVTPMAPGDFPIATQPAPPPGGQQECMAALLEGTLAGDRERGLAIEASTGEVVAVAWPYGYRGTEGPPVALLDEGRDVVAVIGDVVSVGGGFGGDGRFVACPSDISRAGDLE
jgi:hypothetical protein